MNMHIIYTHIHTYTYNICMYIYMSARSLRVYWSSVRFAVVMLTVALRAPKKWVKIHQDRDGDCEWLLCLSLCRYRCLCHCCCCLMTYWKFHLKFVYSRSERHSRHSHAHTHTPTIVRSAVKKIKIKIEQSKMCLCLGSSKQNKTKRIEEMRHKQREDVAMCVWWADYQHLGKPNKSQ